MMKSTRTTLLATALLLAVTSSAQAGPKTCLAVTAGGAALAVASLFTGPGIFITGPLIAGYVALTCKDSAKTTLVSLSD